MPPALLMLGLLAGLCYIDKKKADAETVAPKGLGPIDPSLVPTKISAPVHSSVLAAQWEERLRKSDPNAYWTEEQIKENPYLAVMSHVRTRKS
jgi:hypothetical protein